MHHQFTFLVPDAPPGGCDPLFLAWLAGFVDGEGSIMLLRQKSRFGDTLYIPALGVFNTVRAPLDEIRAWMGAGGVNAPKPRIAGGKPVYSYRVSGSHAQQAVRLIRPYLRIKGEQADVLLAFTPLPRMQLSGSFEETRRRREQARAPQAALWARLRELKDYRGHNGGDEMESPVVNAVYPDDHESISPLRSADIADVACLPTTDRDIDRPTDTLVRVLAEAWRYHQRDESG